jgi:hypothetical protein
MTYRVPNATHEELLNWARWANLGAWPHPLPATRCGSAEGDYRSPPEFSEDLAEPVQAWRIRPNERNARKVQGAWEVMHSKQRLVLKAEYPARQGPRADAAAGLDMSIQEYETHLRYAVMKVEVAIAVRA